ETADHSLPYVIAAAIAERQVTPRQFKDDKIMDPIIRAQLNKVVVKADAEIEALFPELQRVKVKITTTDGREFKKQIDYPKGDPRNPLTDAEIEEKFDALASPVMSEAARTKLKEAIWNIDKLETITELMDLCKIDL
ncbi:MmgE/PrpD family protein, partial [Myxococcota bacterium]|nr:MmgE/PrpD family protein [Myxococcota bacterium]